MLPSQADLKYFNYVCTIPKQTGRSVPSPPAPWLCHGPPLRLQTPAPAELEDWGVACSNLPRHNRNITESSDAHRLWPCQAPKPVLDLCAEHLGIWGANEQVQSV